jgi:hypothetical protein
MSQGFITYGVASQINAIATLGGSVNCEGFAHRIYGSSVAFSGPGEQNVAQITVPENSGLIIVGVEMKVLYDTADTDLDFGDFRSTFDLNPYGPYVGIGAVGQIRIIIGGQQYCATMFDFSLLGTPILLIVESEKDFILAVDPLQPAGKDITLVTKIHSYTVPATVASELKKKETQFLAAV